MDISFPGDTIHPTTVPNETHLLVFLPWYLGSSLVSGEGRELNTYSWHFRRRAPKGEKRKGSPLPPGG